MSSDNRADRQKLTSTAVPQPRARFSPGVRIGDLVQVSGQGPLDPATGAVRFVGDVAGQTTATMEAVKAVLEAGGASVDDVVMFRVYLTDAAFFDEMNAAFNRFIDEQGTTDVPACRTTAIVGLALPDMLVEIDAMAVVQH